jgi:hypothetical protein
MDGVDLGISEGFMFLGPMGPLADYVRNFSVSFDMHLTPIDLYSVAISVAGSA